MHRHAPFVAGRALGPGLHNIGGGLCMRPSVSTNVPHDMIIVRDETFAPRAPIQADSLGLDLNCVPTSRQRHRPGPRQTVSSYSTASQQQCYSRDIQMVSARPRWLIAAALLFVSPHYQAVAEAGPKATPEQIESQTVVDEGGRPVGTGEFALPNYPTVPRPTQSREPLASMEAARAAIVSATPTAQRAFTSFASLGECLGCTGLPLFNNNGRPEFFASTAGMQLPGAAYPAPVSVRLRPRARGRTELWSRELRSHGASCFLLLPTC